MINSRIYQPSLTIHVWQIVAICLLVVLLVVANLMLGSVTIPFSETLKSLSGTTIANSVWGNIIWRTRLPQALVALAAGMAMGVSGLMMQTLFRNPLAGPSVLGISSGASLGVAIVILAAGQLFQFSFSVLGIWGDIAVISASMIGAMGVLMLILFISRKMSGTLGVLIMGVMIGYLSNSLVGILKFYSLEEDVHHFVIWGLGSFSRLAMGRAIFFSSIVIAVSALSLLLGKTLNLLSLGERYARNLGLRINHATTLVILVAGVLTAFVTAFCGPIIFIGMAVPHLAKMIGRTSNHLYLIAYSALIGSVTALFCLLVARLPGIDSELPINSVTAFVGAPVVISVIWKKRMKE